MADEGERYGITAEGGVYGAPLAPEFFVILVDAAAAETTDQLFQALVLGFSQAGAVVDEAEARSGTRRGSEYRCVSAVAGPDTAGACMWRDDGNVGIVLEMAGDTRSTRQLLWTVHDTVATEGRSREARLASVIAERRDPLHRSMRPTARAVVVNGKHSAAAGLVAGAPLVEAGDRWTVLDVLRSHRGGFHFDGQLHRILLVSPRF